MSTMAKTVYLSPDRVVMYLTAARARFPDCATTAWSMSSIDTSCCTNMTAAGLRSLVLVLTVKQLRNASKSSELVALQTADRQPCTLDGRERSSLAVSRDWRVGAVFSLAGVESPTSIRHNVSVKLLVNRLGCVVMGDGRRSVRHDVALVGALRAGQGGSFPCFVVETSTELGRATVEQIAKAVAMERIRCPDVYSITVDFSHGAVECHHWHLRRRAGTCDNDPCRPGGAFTGGSTPERIHWRAETPSGAECLPL